MDVYEFKRWISVMLAVLFAASPAFSQSTAEKNTKEKAILAISDFHFDPFYACQFIRTKPCPMVAELRRSDISAWASIFSKYEHKMGEYDQDSSYRLFNASLIAAKNSANKYQVKFVMMLGDVLSHGFRDEYRNYARDKTYAGFLSFIRKTEEFALMQMSDTFDNWDVYPVVGNNDFFAGDYAPSPRAQYYEHTADVWSDLIKNPAICESVEAQFSKAGYYAVDVPNQANLRLIVLNSILFSYKAKGEAVSSAAQQELHWFHQQLSQANARRQKVYVLMHIPPSYDIHATPSVKLFTLIKLWRDKYIDAFNSELTQYSSTIAAVFVGHLHSDFLQVHDDGNGENTHIYATPSISPIFGNDPAYKVYFYQPTTKLVTKSITFTNHLNHGMTWNPNS